MIDLGIGNFLTLITEFIAIRAGLGFFGVRPWIAILIATRNPLRRIDVAPTLLDLGSAHPPSDAAIFNLIFIPVALMTHPSWALRRHAFVNLATASRFQQRRPPHRPPQTSRHVNSLDAFLPAKRPPSTKAMTIKDIRFGRIDNRSRRRLATAGRIATILATAPLFRPSK